MTAEVRPYPQRSGKKMAGQSPPFERSSLIQLLELSLRQTLCRLASNIERGELRSVFLTALLAQNRHPVKAAGELHVFGLNRDLVPDESFERGTHHSLRRQSFLPRK